MPVRKFRTSARSLVGFVASEKSEGAAHFESALERDLLALLDFDVNVDRFEVQPLHIEFVDAQGRHRRYTPDVLVRWNDLRPTTLYEVKPREALFRDWKDLKPRFKAARAFCRERGWEFKILTEVEIRTVTLDNVQFLREFLRKDWKADANFVADVKAGIENFDVTTPIELIESMEQNVIAQAHLLYAMWQLVAEGVIGVDMNEPLTTGSRIWKVEEHDGGITGT